MKFFKWIEGRQKDCKYWKFPLWFFRIGRWGFDAYILKYANDTLLPLHRDPVQGKHWRLNIKLKGESVFFVENKGTTSKRMIFFRPDLYSHSLTVYKRTTKLSFGFVKFDI